MNTRPILIILVASAVAIVFGSWGCAFKNPPDSSEIALQTDGSEKALPIQKGAVRLSWSEPSVLERQIERKAEGVWQIKPVVTLPPEVPAQLNWTVSLPSNALPEKPTLILTTLTTPAGIRSIPSQLEDSTPGKENQLILTLKTEGLNTLFDPKQSQTAQVKIEILSAKQKMIELQADLRTPPLQLGVEPHSLKALRKMGEQFPVNLNSIRRNSGRLNLVRALLLTNQESVAVSFTLPRTLTGQMGQDRTQLVHRDIGCNGNGFTVDRQSNWDVISNQLYFVPMDQRLLPEVDLILKGESLLGTSQTRLEPGATLWLGIYARGPETDTWLDSGPRGNALQNVTVSSNCYEVCIQTECGSGGCGPRCPLLKIPEMTTLQHCWCSRNETRRNQATVTVGAERGGYSLHLDATQMSIPVRFADVDPLRDPVVRQLTLVPTVTSVDWF